jgi:hypothetical protein
MNEQKCRICGEGAIKVFSGKVIDRNVAYFDCPSCGYVQTEQPTWLEQAYAEAINDSDTGIVVRNQSNAQTVIATLFLLGKLGGRVIDFAGGYGLLVRMLRDSGVEALWTDRYCKNLLAKGFEYQGEKADLVTAFEAFEHFVNPAEELTQMLSVAPNVLLSTEIVPEPIPKPDAWWYYGLDHGQHIGFFRLKTLSYLAPIHNKKLITDGRSFHLFTDAEFSPFNWKLTRFVIRHAPRLVTYRLTSKTWSDHCQVVGKMK